MKVQLDQGSKEVGKPDIHQKNGVPQGHHLCPMIFDPASTAAWSQVSNKHLRYTFHPLQHADN